MMTRSDYEAFLLRTIWRTGDTEVAPDVSVLIGMGQAMLNRDLKVLKRLRTADVSTGKKARQTLDLTMGSQDGTATANLFGYDNFAAPLFTDRGSLSPSNILAGEELEVILIDNFNNFLLQYFTGGVPENITEFFVEGPNGLSGTAVASSGRDYIIPAAEGWYAAAQEAYGGPAVPIAFTWTDGEPWADNDSVLYPADYHSLRTLQDLADPARPLTYLAPADFLQAKALGSRNFTYTLTDKLELMRGGSDESPRKLRLSYYSVIPEYTDQPTWVQTSYLDLFNYACLYHTAPYLREDARIQTWQNMYGQALQSVLSEDAAQKYDGSPLRPRMPGVVA